MMLPNTGNAATRLRAQRFSTDGPGRRSRTRTPRAARESLESRGPGRRDCKGALQGQANSAQRAFVEQPADQRDAVRHTARRVELGQRMIRIRSPIAARLGNFNETGTDGQ